MKFRDMDKYPRPGQVMQICIPAPCISVRIYICIAIMASQHMHIARMRKGKPFHSFYEADQMV